MNDALSFASNLCAAGVARGTPTLLASLGELLSERSGVLNLGVEGLMLAGAMAGVGAASASGSAATGLCVAMLAGTALALVHAFVCVGLRADPIVSGLALVFLGTGLSSVLGAPLVSLGSSVPRFEDVPIPLLSGLPFLGPVLFRHSALVYGSVLLAVLLHLGLTRTRPGLAVIACGENPEAAAALGIPWRRVRCACVAAGGALAGMAGGMLSLCVTPGWVEGMTAGQGWIALGVVIVARWNPLYAVGAAWIFGMVRRLPLDLQGLDVPFFQDPNVGFFLNMLPYLATVAVLVASRTWAGRGMRPPAALGRM